jgi:hypothetical protein
VSQPQKAIPQKKKRQKQKHAASARPDAVVCRQENLKHSVAQFIIDRRTELLRASWPSNPNNKPYDFYLQNAIMQAEEESIAKFGRVRHAVVRP